MAETQIYQNNEVAVTTSKVVVGGNTYFLRNIASISVVKIPNFGARIVFIGGVFMALAGIVNIKESWILGLIGGALIFTAVKSGLSSHWVQFATNAGSVNAYKGPVTLMHEIKCKIEEAMAARE